MPILELRFPTDQILRTNTCAGITTISLRANPEDRLHLLAMIVPADTTTEAADVASTDSGYLRGEPDGSLSWRRDPENP